MIELNLLPEEFRKKKKKIELPEIPLVPIGVILLGAILAIQLILSGFIFLCKRQIANLDKQHKDISPRQREISKIKRQISTLEEKANAIERLIETQLNWAHLLSELSNSTTSNIWLNKLSYDEKIEKAVAELLPGMPAKKGESKSQAKPKDIRYRIRTITLSGSASGKGEEATANIAQFIRALKENSDFFKEFDDIELVSIKKAVRAEQDIMNFTLVCKFKPQKD